MSPPYFRSTTQLRRQIGRLARSQPASERSSWHCACSGDPSQGRPHLWLARERRTVDTHPTCQITAPPHSAPERTASVSTTPRRSSWQQAPTSWCTTPSCFPRNSRPRRTSATRSVSMRSVLPDVQARHRSCSSTTATTATMTPSMGWPAAGRRLSERHVAVPGHHARARSERNAADPRQPPALRRTRTPVSHAAIPRALLGTAARLQATEPDSPTFFCTPALALAHFLRAPGTLGLGRAYVDGSLAVTISMQPSLWSTSGSRDRRRGQTWCALDWRSLRRRCQVESRAVPALELILRGELHRSSATRPPFATATTSATSSSRCSWTTR